MAGTSPEPARPLQQRRLARRRRLRRWLRRLPRRANIGRYPVIRRFADAAWARPWLWSLRHREVMVSLYAGSVLALLPTYGFQLLLGFVLAVVLRGNLTVMTALQMVVNPLTIAPIYAGTWALGHGLASAAGIDLGGGDPRAHAVALVIGGVVAGLGFALVLDALWRAGAWEAARFRARVQAEARAHGDAA